MCITSFIQREGDSAITSLPTWPNSSFCWILTLKNINKNKWFYPFWSHLQQVANNALWGCYTVQSIVWFFCPGVATNTNPKLNRRSEDLTAETAGDEGGTQDAAPHDFWETWAWTTPVKPYPEPLPTIAASCWTHWYSLVPGAGYLFISTSPMETFRFDKGEKSNSASFDRGRLIFIRDRMAHFYLFSSWKSKKWEVKPASPWQPLQRGVLSRWRGVIMELKFSACSHSRWDFCFVFPRFFSLGPVRCGLVHFSGVER